MTSQENIIWDTVDNLVEYDIDDNLPDIIDPTRTVLIHQNNPIHLWRCCYDVIKPRWRGNGGSVLESSLCPIRTEIVRRVIQNKRSFLGSQLRRLTALINDIADRGLKTAVFEKDSALAIYKQMSEELLAERDRSKIKAKTQGTKSRANKQLQEIQGALCVILSICSEQPPSVIALSAEKIISRRRDRLTRATNPSISEAEADTSYAVHEQYFYAMSDYLEQGDFRHPLHIKLEDLGYPNYALYTVKVDSYSIKEKRKSDILYRACFDENGMWIGGTLKEIKARFEALDLVYETDKYAFLKNRYITHTTPRLLAAKEATLHRRLAIHFVSMLLLVSGGNREQLQFLDFEKKLGTGSNAKRIPAVKPRADYYPKPISFSAKFVPIWRRYVAIRRMTIARYGADYGDFGIPFVDKHHQLSEMSAVQFAKARLRLPPDLDRSGAFTGRKFKTVRLLDQTNGDVSLVSKIIGRNEATTRKYYLWKDFTESAASLTDFFNALTDAATIKAKDYSARIPILEQGEPTPTGRCEDKEQTGPSQIEGVTEFASEPRCGAPVTCFFCTHYGIHAEVEDIKLILSAKAWLLRQTRASSIDINEHIGKYLPIIERIDDILEDFKAQSERHASIAQTAIDDIARGNYSPFWKLKLDAFLDAMEDF